MKKTSLAINLYLFLYLFLSAIIFNCSRDFVGSNNQNLDLDITSSKSAIYQNNFTVFFNFESEVNDFESNDIHIIGGSFDNFRELTNNKTYTIDVFRTPTNSSLMLIIPGGSFYNSKGIANDSSYTNIFAFQIEPIDLNIITPESAISDTNFIVTFDFLNPVLDFESNDITIVGGSFVNFRELTNDKTYSIDVFRNPIDSPVVLTVFAQSFHNSQGISNSNSYSNTIEIEHPILPLIITEVGNNHYVDSSIWIEIYNLSNYSVNLGDYTLRCAARNSNQTSEDTNIYFQEFELPSRTILPGEFMIIRGNPNNERSDSYQLIYINQIDNSSNLYYPYISSNGEFFFELKRSDWTSDFVKSGYSAFPMTGSFSGDAPAPIAMSSYDHGMSVARDQSLFDSDSGSDWILGEISTFGGFNDVISSADTDMDGIPDANESPGTTFAGMPLYDWGARPNIKDIFIHIDYMNSANKGIIPNKEALDLIVLTFSNQNINVHFDVGDLFHQSPGISPLEHDLSDDSHQVPFQEIIFFSSESRSLTTIYDYKGRYMPIIRKQIFHYTLFANTQEAGGVGRAEIQGNDILITLSSFANEFDSSDRYLINIQSSVLMHELGHNLGLLHGGNESQNYKPNYYSVMNYLYVLPGLPPVGAVYERYFNEVADVAINLSNLTDGPLSTSFRIDYSDGTSIPLDESNLNESLGIGRGLGAINWNTNGASNDNNFSFNINPTERQYEISVLNDHNDWSNLFFTFYRSPEGNRDLSWPSTTDDHPNHFRRVISETEDKSQKWSDPCFISHH